MPVERSSQAGATRRASANETSGSRARGGRGAGGGRGGRGGRSGGYTPYEPPIFGSAQSLSFDSRNEADWDEALLDTPGIQSIHFGANFNVEDKHLLAIAARPWPALAASLRSLSLGDSDTGEGGSITNEGVVSLVTACRRLRVLSLDAALNINDATLLKCCELLPSLEKLRITGHDKSHGAVKDAFLKKLKETPKLAPQLKQLDLYDQSIYDYKGMEALRKARKGLLIKRAIQRNIISILR